MKYKVGDKVRVREDLKEGERYGKYYFVPPMWEYIGQIVTIKKVCSNRYYIAEDIGTWTWTDKMLEPIEKGE